MVDNFFLDPQNSMNKTFKLWGGVILDDVSMINTILGTIGAVLGILSYLRDRTNVIVRLCWDMEPFGQTDLDENELYGYISIANTGKRPIFLSHVHIVNLLEPTKLFIPEMKYMAGQSLSEIDKPLVIPVPQRSFNKYSKSWYNLRVCIIDLNGKEYYSKLIFCKPSWGEGKFNAWVVGINTFKVRFNKIKRFMADCRKNIDLF